jgi:hypothetical protein
MGNKVPFAVVQWVCKYVGDKVGNRPIAAIRDLLLYGRQIDHMKFGSVTNRPSGLEDNPRLVR